jgi:hypothetical protein
MVALIYQDVTIKFGPEHDATTGAFMKPWESLLQRFKLAEAINSAREAIAEQSTRRIDQPKTKEIIDGLNKYKWVSYVPDFRNLPYYQDPGGCRWVYVGIDWASNGWRGYYP